MIKGIPDFLQVESHKEQFFTDSIDFGNIKIYPYYDFSVILNSEKSGACSFSPIAAIFCELVGNEVKDYHLYYFDESKKSEKLTITILDRFCSEIKSKKE